MVHKFILTEFQYSTLCKVLRANPPSRVTGLVDGNLDGAELRAYREILTMVLKENFLFPDTDDK